MFFNTNFKKNLSGYEKRGTVKLFHGLAGTLLLFFFWTIGGHFLLSRPGYEQFTGFLPIPTFKALFALTTEIGFWESVFASLRRVTLGIFIAFVIGLPSGLLIGFYAILRQITYPPIQFLRMISPISWMPIALMVFKSFESAIYFLISVATVWPIILNITSGVSHVDPKWIKMAKDQGAKNSQLILRIVIPASIPHILTSLRLALGIAWIVLVPAEFLGISSGLGYIINDARDTLEYDRLMAIVIAIGIIGFILDGFLKIIEQTFGKPWKNETS